MSKGNWKLWLFVVLAIAIAFAIAGCSESIGPFEVPLTNGSFETGDLTGWDKQNLAYIITDVGGIVTPVHGSHLCLISSGTGPSLGRSSISQKTKVPSGYTTARLKLNWNFASCEFWQDEPGLSPYDPSYPYQDYFEILLVDEGGATHTLFRKSIYDFASEYSLTQITLDSTASMTGWQEFQYDLSTFAGQIVTLILAVGNWVDTEAESVVMVDNVRFQIVP